MSRGSVSLLARYGTVLGLVLYGGIAASGPFVSSGLATDWFFPWAFGYLVVTLLVGYQTYLEPPPPKEVPFPFVVLGIILLNFAIQVTGGVRSYLWPVYFLYAVVVAAFSPPRRAYLMALIILAIESASLLLTSQDVAGRLHLYAGFGITLAAVSAAASHLMLRSRIETVRALDAHAQLIADADAIDPLAEQSDRISPLTREHRRKAHVKAAQQRDSDLTELIELIYGFVPADTYALFLREKRDGREVSVLRAVRTSRDHAIMPIGTDLDPSRDGLITDIDACAAHRRAINHPDIGGQADAVAKLGYYQRTARDLPVRSYLMLPILRNEQTIAVLAVDSSEPGAFAPETVDMLERFAPFFIQLIDKIDMTMQLKTRADHFGALHTISSELNKTLWFGDTMRSIIPKLRDIIPFDLCACVLAGEQDGRQQLTFATLAGYDESFLGRSFPLEESSIMTYMRKHWLDQGILKYYTADFGDRGRDIGLFPFRELQHPVRSMFGRLLVGRIKNDQQGEQEVLRGAVFLASFRPDAFTEYHRESLLDTLMNHVSQVAHNSLLYQRIEDMARTDGLTGLLNHRTFMEKLHEKYRELERSPHPFSLLLMDIDKFKGVNDTYGHPVGDQAIKAVARILLETVRSTDFVARYGGEEFAVGLIETPRKEAERLAERVRKTMEQAVVTRVADGELKVTLSIGVVTFPEDTEDKTALVGMADEALYHAKRTGRNKVCLYRDAVQASQTGAT